MTGRILELSRNGLAVHKSRGFLSVRNDDGELGKVELDDIDVVLVSASGLMWSNTALSELALRNIPVMILTSSFVPSAVVMPLSGHGEQGYKMASQIAASRVLLKQIWAQLVRRKISAQAAFLDEIDCSSERIRKLAEQVRSGDPDNKEGQAAQVYWPLVFGKAFRRDRNQDGINAMLNYGYTVLRAATIRAIVSSGLHPSLSVHHKSGGDAFSLADDLMEPYRPSIDRTVYYLWKDAITTVPKARHALVDTLSASFRTREGESPLSHVLVRLSQSIVRSFQSGKSEIVFPDTLLPLIQLKNGNT